MKRTIEIDDTLQDTVDQCIDELKTLITEFIDQNPDHDDICLSNDIDSSCAFHEVIDRNTPIYYSEINGLHYLYSDLFEEAYKNSGIYDETPENYKQVAIYLYLEQKCWEWWHENSEDFIEEYKEKLAA